MRIFFSAGEPSGDQHAAHLIKALQQQNSGIKAEGFGGPEMGRVGCSLHFELTQMAVMGFVRVLPMIAKFRRLVIKAEKHFDENPPDAVVLVDFPGFNWWIAKAAKKRGIPVYYYLPPQLWAWAPWRIKKIRRFVDHVICGLPFEYDWYRDRGVEATWVGHPFFDEVAAKQLDTDLVAELRGRDDQRLIGVLPGSRHNEVVRNFPIMLQALQKVSDKCPAARFVVGAYKEEHVAICRQFQDEANCRCDITYLVDRTSEVVEAADCCLMVSGSISLELLARRTPGIVLYRIALLEDWISRFLQNCRFITLTNLIADEEVMPEFKSSGNPQKHVDAISQWLIENCTDSDVLKSRRQTMSELAQKAADIGAGKRTADVILNLLANEASSADSQQVAA